jgi:carbamoyl-phosphate synthase large subunit
MVVNTLSGASARDDENKIRTVAIQRQVPLITTIAGARAASLAIEAMLRGKMGVKALQDYHCENGAGAA